MPPMVRNSTADLLTASAALSALGTGLATHAPLAGLLLAAMNTALSLAVFAVLYLGERLSWNYFAAMGCLVAAVAFIFLPGAAAGGH